MVNGQRNRIGKLEKTIFDRKEDQYRFTFETDYTAWQGFQELGFKPTFYSTEKDLTDCRPDDLIVGGVSTNIRKMNEYTSFQNLIGRK